MEAAPPSAEPVPEREPLSLGEIRDVWPLLAHADRIQAFLLLPRDEAEDFFFGLPARDQGDVVLGVPARVSDIMRTQVVTMPEQMDQEAVATKFAQSRLLALPVVDAGGHMKGIVTADDVVDVVREEATEDMQKVGGVEALEAPYLEV